MVLLYARMYMFFQHLISGRSKQTSTKPNSIVSPIDIKELASDKARKN